MAFWTEIHWHEGMFLRPHHMQVAQRRSETLLHQSLDVARVFAWGFLDLLIAEGPLAKASVRIDRCQLRLKDGTWVRVPENTEVPPLNLEAPLAAAPGGVDVFLGIPEMQEVRPNAISLQQPEQTQGNPRYEPLAVARRDENTGANPQIVYVRRMRGRLFAAGEDMTGYDAVRLCRIRRTDRPGAVPGLDENGAGPLLAIQADPGLSGLLTALADQVEAKDELLAREAREHEMLFTDGVAANTEHLLKLHALNAARAELRLLQQCPRLHPYDLFVALGRLVGQLSIFHPGLVPGILPGYEHDRPAESLSAMAEVLRNRLEGLRPEAYVAAPFTRKKDPRGHDGLQVALERAWIDDKLDMYVALRADDKTVDELYQFIRGKFDLKLASPAKAPRIVGTSVSGLAFQIRSVPPGTLPRHRGLHYFHVEKRIGSDGVDYWRECEQEQGIRIALNEAQLPEMERFRPTLYVCLRRPGK
jgi:type VI secretion system protein ImpJ